MTKILKEFNLDFSDLPQTSVIRNFTIVGDDNAEFILEITRGDGKYYNFTQRTWQSTKTFLETKIKGKNYIGQIKFSANTSSGDQYDISFWAKVGTEHADYDEVRFPDNSVDINSSVGSNSLLIKKVIYQNLNTALTLTTYSPNDTANIIEESSKVDSEITVSPYQSHANQAFTISCEVNNAAQSYQIIKQPTTNDILAIHRFSIGSAPEILPGEDEYPAVSNSSIVNGDFSAGNHTKIVIDDAVADKITIGDKVTVTSALKTGTVNATVNSGQKIVLTSGAAAICAVGDRVSGITGISDTTPVSVTHIDPDGDNANEIQIDHVLSGSVYAEEEDVLTFTPEVNYSVTTVTVLNPDGDNVNEFTVSQQIGLVDDVTLGFSNRKNYQWPLDNIENITEGMQVFPGNNADVYKTENLIASSTIAKYEDTITLNEGTVNEQIIIENSAPFKTTKNQTPTVANGIVTTQAGNIVFNNQQPLALASDIVWIGGYGTDKIFDLRDYIVKFTNLKIELDTITTTTTAAVVNSTTIPVASVNGILPNVSTVSGIGIDASAVDPTVNSRSVTSGAGDLVLSAAQNLENGTTLTFANAGQKATITGNIEVLKAGKNNTTLRFDVEKLLSIT